MRFHNIYILANLQGKYSHHPLHLHRIIKDLNILVCTISGKNTALPLLSNISTQILIRKRHLKKKTPLRCPYSKIMIILRYLMKNIIDGMEHLDYL